MRSIEAVATWHASPSPTTHAPPACDSTLSIEPARVCATSTNPAPSKRNRRLPAASQVLPPDALTVVGVPPSKCHGCHSPGPGEKRVRGQHADGVAGGDASRSWAGLEGPRNVRLVQLPQPAVRREHPGDVVCVDALAVERQELRGRLGPGLSRLPQKPLVVTALVERAALEKLPVGRGVTTQIRALERRRRGHLHTRQILETPQPRIGQHRRVVLAPRTHGPERVQHHVALADVGRVERIEHADALGVAHRRRHPEISFRRHRPGALTVGQRHAKNPSREPRPVVKHEDGERRGRRLAQAALELNADVDGWAPSVVGGPVSRGTGVDGLVALARVGGPKWQAGLVSACVDRGLDAEDEEHSLAVLRALELSFARDGVPGGDVRAEALAMLEKSYDAAITRVGIQLTKLLVALESEAVPPIAVPALRHAETQEDAIELAYILRVCEHGWTDELAADYLRMLHVDLRGLRGGRSLEGYVERIREEATERLAPEGWTPPEVETPAERVVEATLFERAWTLEELLGLEADVKACKDVELGRMAYERASCADCHRLGGVGGGGTGPDLDGAGARYSMHDMLVALCDPSRDIPDLYQLTEVWTTDGLVHVGRIVEEDDDWVTLRLKARTEDELEGPLLDVAKDEVKTRRPHPSSPMPQGTLDVLKKEEIIALLALLRDA